jgi:hypothetical protein
MRNTSAMHQCRTLASEQALWQSYGSETCARIERLSWGNQLEISRRADHSAFSPSHDGGTELFRSGSLSDRNPEIMLMRDDGLTLFHRSRARTARHPDAAKYVV